MSLRAGSRCALVFAALLLAACAGQRIRPVAGDAATLAAQERREHELAARTDWTLRGRLAVSDGRDSGSGALEWNAHGDAYRFSLHAPVTGKTWVLAGDDRHARLEGLRDEPVEAADAAELLWRELGWKVPIAQLRAWARGMRASPAARITFDADGLPATIDEDGWTIRYPEFDRAQSPPLPLKVFADKGPYRVRLAIKSWQAE